MKASTNQYYKKHEDLLQQLHTLNTQRRDAKQEIVETLAFKGEAEAEKLGNEKKAYLGTEWIKDHKELIGEYRELRKSYQADKKAFEQILSQALAVNPDLPKEEQKLLEKMILGEGEYINNSSETSNNAEELKKTELPYDQLPNHIKNLRSDVTNWIEKAPKEREEYQAVIDKFQEHLANGNITYGVHNGKIEARDHLSKTAFGPAMSAPSEWKDKEGEYEDGKNYFKKLLRYFKEGNKNWFFNMANTQDQDLIYKGTIDQPANSKVGKQFREQLKTDLYDKGYERTKQATYQQSMDVLFPGMTQDQQLLGILLLTGFIGRGWFQEDGEIFYTPGQNLVFNNKLSGQYRHCLESFASSLYFFSGINAISDIALLSSRSIEN